MVTRDYFTRLSIQGKAALADGGFFCQACLVGKPVGEQSQNKRFCINCYDFMQVDTIAAGVIDSDVRDSIGVGEGVPKIIGGESTIGRDSGSKRKDYGTTRGRDKKQGPGRPIIVTPDAKIHQLAAQGYSIRQISTETLASRSTVQRVLSGQRALMPELFLKKYTTT